MKILKKNIRKIEIRSHTIRICIDVKLVLGKMPNRLLWSQKNKDFLSNIINLNLNKASLKKIFKIIIKIIIIIIIIQFLVFKTNQKLIYKYLVRE